MSSNNSRRQPAKVNLGYLIFLSRWLQAPLYFGLIVAQAVYVWVFLKELWHLVSHVGALSDSADASFTESDVLLIVLGLVDVVMIANLLIMVIIGGYETFVARLRIDNHPDEPEWLSHVNANVLKVKLAMAIIGISSVGLLRTFIEAGSDSNQQTNDEIMWQVIIHLTFIVSALALAWIDRMYNKSQPPEHGHSNDQPTPDNGVDADAELSRDGVRSNS